MIKTQFPCGMLWLSETVPSAAMTERFAVLLNTKMNSSKIIQPEEAWGTKGHNEGIKRSFATGQRSPRR